MLSLVHTEAVPLEIRGPNVPQDGHAGARTRPKKQRAEEVDRLFCIRTASLTRNLRRSGIGPTLATFGAEHTTSETR